MTVLGLIPARGGSKRVPGKNTRELGGIPLIAWTITSAKVAQSLDLVAVSSEDEEILAIAKTHQCRLIPRPPEMAADAASSYPLILHALELLPERYDDVCLLQPTSPFRGPRHIDECIDLHIRLGAACTVSKVTGQRVPNGAIYVARVDWLREALARGDPAPFDGPAACAYYMHADNSIDIDTEADFNQAEAMAITAIAGAAM